MNVLLIDAHPDTGRYSSHLLAVYEQALPPGCTATTVALRDLTFNPNLANGYRQRTEWEPDLHRLAQALDECDHLALAFPMWWGAEPATLKGLLDRVFLPGFTFAYHDNDTWWDKLMVGRSADAIITMDTPPIFLRLAYGNSIIQRWKKQVLGFAGFKPVRILPLGQIKFGGVEKRGVKWETKVRRLAKTIRQKEAQKKQARLAAFLNNES